MEGSQSTQEEPLVTVSGEAQLLTLFRALHAAKFAIEPEYDSLPGSPILARLISETFNAIQRLEEYRLQSDSSRTAAHKKATLQARVQSTYMKPVRSEWTVIVARAAEAANWPAWSRADRISYLELLSAPYLLDAEHLQQAIDQANALVSPE